MQPLASAGSARPSTNTNLSTSLALSVLDASGNELVIRTDRDHPIELIIPRDPNAIVPPMVLQNVTVVDRSPHRQLFNLHFSNISSVLPVSVHFEMRPHDGRLGYLFVYRFGTAPQLNSSIHLVDGWTVFCAADTHTFFIDNEQTLGHESVIFGVRELNASEMHDLCAPSSTRRLPISDEPMNFSGNYDLRVYTSGCYYLDESNQWQADGLLVGPLTDHRQTQCFSTHLTSFAGGFLVLPAPVNWKYVYAKADVAKHKTIYIMLMVTVVLYMLVMRVRVFISSIVLIMLMDIVIIVCVWRYCEVNLQVADNALRLSKVGSFSDSFAFMVEQFGRAIGRLHFAARVQTTMIYFFLLG